MTSSPSPFTNTGKLQVLPNSTTLVFTPTSTNIHSSPNTTYIQPQTISTPTSIVRLNQPNQYSSPTIWTNNSSQYSPTIKTEPTTSTILPAKIVAQPVVRQTVQAPTTTTQRFTEAQINDFVIKCRTFLTTLLKLAEKQAPEKLPMVRSCIQDLLSEKIDPELFTQRLHTLYKSQPHTSLVPFFKLALPHMRQMVQRTFGQPITIELLEKLNIPTSKNNPTTTTTTAAATTTPSRVVVNPSLLTQQSTSLGQQPLLYTTVQPQQKINLLQQTPQSTLIGSTTSLLGQQQQLQQQARAQISITGIRPLLTTVSPSTSTNLLTGQQSIQPVTQTIIQPSDSILQRTFLSPATNTNVQQPQIITVNHQSIKTSQQPSLIQIQQRTLIKNDDDSLDEMPTTNGLLTTTDDRNARHISTDDSLLPSLTLRRRLDQLIKEKRWEGGNMLIHDEKVSAIISHATEQRLKCLIEKIHIAAYHREAISNLVVPEKNEDDDDDDELKQTNTRKRKSNENTWQELKRLRSIKRHCRAHLPDLISIMTTDKQLKRSSLLYKALDKSS